MHSNILTKFHACQYTPYRIRSGTRRLMCSSSLAGSLTVLANRSLGPTPKTSSTFPLPLVLVSSIVETFRFKDFLTPIESGPDHRRVLYHRSTMLSRLLTILLLISAVSGAYIRLYPAGGCRGNYYQCNNTPVNFCCYRRSPALRSAGKSKLLHLWHYTSVVACATFPSKPIR